MNCPDCGLAIDRNVPLVHTFPDIPHLVDRLLPGDTVPFAECPKCGALLSKRYLCQVPGLHEKGDE